MNKASLSAGRLICSDAKETVMLLHMMGDIRSIYIGDYTHLVRFQVVNVDVCGQNNDYLKLDMSLLLLDILLYKLVMPTAV